MTPQDPKLTSAEREEKKRLAESEKRSELLAGAIRAIRKHGPEASMTEIAREAGFSKPVFYDYFGDKSGLAAALTDRLLGNLEMTFDVLLDGTHSARDAVHSAIDIFVSFALKEPQLYRFLVRGATSPNVVATLPSLMPPIAEVIVRYLEEQLSEAGRETDSAETMAVAILGMVFSTTEWWLSVRHYVPDNYVEHLTDLVCSGLVGAGISSAS
ncbi:MAG: TetR/AcrR family transcriptional regulator [Acidimicrobiales bacterium]|nr:TetR/AcrR family transcriptional regulator [Acidimicrobiales bacterium]